MMKEEFLDSYDGYQLGFPMDPMEPPSLYSKNVLALCPRYFDDVLQVL